MDASRLTSLCNETRGQTHAHAPRSSTQSKAARRQFVLTLVVGGAIGLSSVGCAGRSTSFASLNPFKGKPADSTAAQGPSMFASTGQFVGKAATGTATATKNVFAKTSAKIGGIFGKDSTDNDFDDPLSLESNPEKLEPDVFVANGQLWESTGNMTKAMEAYSKALETEPNNAKALTSIARLHFREGNHPQSAEYFQKAIAQDPSNAALYNDLGLTLSKLGQHDMASQTLTRALQLAPGTSRYANNLASVYFESGKSDKALNVLSQNNKPAVAHFNMAFLHYKKGQTAQAQSHLQQSLSHEHEAVSDPATKRAIDRSREMLAQISPAGVTPSATPAPGTASPTQNMPGVYPPAAGPAAVVAAAPAHRANQTPQVLGQMTPGSVGQQPVVPGATSPVSYQDPRSYLNVKPPVAAVTPPATAGPATEAIAPKPAAVTPPVTQPEASTVPASPQGFTLPGGFKLP